MCGSAKVHAWFGERLTTRPLGPLNDRNSFKRTWSPCGSCSRSYPGATRKLLYVLGSDAMTAAQSACGTCTAMWHHPYASGWPHVLSHAATATGAPGADGSAVAGSAPKPSISAASAAAVFTAAPAAAAGDDAPAPAGDLPLPRLATASSTPAAVLFNRTAPPSPVEYGENGRLLGEVVHARPPPPPPLPLALLRMPPLLGLCSAADALARARWSAPLCAAASARSPAGAAAALQPPPPPKRAASSASAALRRALLPPRRSPPPPSSDSDELGERSGGVADAPLLRPPASAARTARRCQAGRGAARSGSLRAEGGDIAAGVAANGAAAAEGWRAAEGWPALASRAAMGLLMLLLMANTV
jgi:hypothetical protein